MIIITEDQAYQRLDTMSDELREVMASDANADFVWKTCQAENIPEDRRYTVSRVTGYVLMGFIHPEDVAQELVETIKIDQNTAKLVQDALNNRIFAPVRSDIDRIYSPLSKSEVRTSSMTASVGPKLIQDIGPVPVTAGVTVAPAPRPSTMSGAQFNSTRSPVLNLEQRTPGAPVASGSSALSMSVPPAPKPATTTDVGWSKTQTSGPVVKLDISNMPPAAPAPAQAPKPAVAPAQPPKPQGGGAVSEFERLNMMKTAPGAGGSTSAATSTAGAAGGAAPIPAPVMLHEDTTFKAAEKNASFTLVRPDAGAEVNMGQVKSGPAVPRPAVLELGKSAPTVAGTQGAPKPPTPGGSQAVHYTNFNPSLASVPTAQSGPRNVSQITPPAPAPSPSVPKPPAPPMSPTAQNNIPPRPPQPPTPPPPDQQDARDRNGQVIVKNFP